MRKRTYSFGVLPALLALERHEPPKLEVGQLTIKSALERAIGKIHECPAVQPDMVYINPRDLQALRLELGECPDCGNILGVNPDCPTCVVGGVMES